MTTTQEESIVLSRGRATTITGDGGTVELRALWDGSVRVDFDGWPCGLGHVLLRVTELVELFDGDLVGAGRQWLSFQAGRHGRPGRLTFLGDDGGPQLALTLRNTALTVGREAGDVVLPGDDALAELHLQVLVRPHGTFVQDLGTESGTWVVLQSGEVLRSGTTIAIGGRVLRVSTPVEGTGSSPSRSLRAAAA